MPSCKRITQNTSNMIVIKIIGILVAIILLAGFVFFAAIITFGILMKYGDLDDSDLYDDDFQD